MVNGSSFQTKSRRLALILLLNFGSVVAILGLLVLSVGLALTYNDKFHDTTGLKEQIETTTDYVQYWIGLPYIITGASVACSAVNLRKISLTVWTIFVSLMCVVLSLAGLVVDGPDFVSWKYFNALQRYWESQDGFACSSEADTCVCTNGTAMNVVISSYTDCETLTILTSVYGILIGCFVLTLVILVASVFIIVYFVTSKREKARRKRRSYHSMTEIEAKQTDPVFENSVREETNRGYEFGNAIEETENPVPVQHRENKQDQVPDSASQQNVDASSIVEQEEIVMMDPGRFRLGDDDIY